MRAPIAAGLFLLSIAACKPNDGAEPPEPSGLVTLRAFDFEGLPTSAFVILHEFDGDAREWLVTNTNGELTFDAAPIVTVAVLNTTTGFAALRTWEGVEGGDELTFGSSGELQGTVLVHATSATAVHFDIGCTGTTTNDTASHPLPIFVDCVKSDGTFDVLSESYTTEEVFQTLTNLPVAVTTSVQLGAWSDAWEDVAIEWTNALPNTEQVFATASTVTEGGAFATRELQQNVMRGGSASFVARLPAGFGATRVQTIHVYFELHELIESYFTASVGTSRGAASLPIDLGELELPRITSVETNASGNHVHWQFSAQVSQVDGAIVQVQWPDPSQPSEGPGYWFWEARVSPSTARSGDFRFPDLPSELEALVPVGVPWNPFVQIFESSLIEDASDFRADPLSSFDSSSTYPAVPYRAASSAAHRL